MAMEIIPSTSTLSPYQEVRRFIKNESNASLIAGGVAGAVSRTVVSPFERAKILLQVQGPGSNHAYNGMFATIFKMYKDEGWRGLFRGNLLNCVRIVPYSAVQFAVFEKCKELLLARRNAAGTQLNAYERLLAGSMGGVISVAVTYPLDLVRARITIQTASLKKLDKGKLTKPPTVFGTISHVYTHEGGFTALYKGIVPTTLGVAPYVAINFALYEKLREYMENSPDDYSNPVWKLSAGAFSSFVGGVLIYPLDVLRKRYQVASMAQGELGFQYKSVPHALVSMFKNEGFFGAYRGLTANLYKIVPSMAVSWLVYDTIKDTIHKW
ncbi:mitochondrial ADP/ATP carrier protein [Scheffersomyces stipitis CBS 6054]|uniref:Mitochondrial thiamine pyrophosphate carrier 1 n=1 Tax=Scheffersomyces stipitis (strain ATCC 58785 / CBS 6054 / NBRC 10063 / NRRL Y-11545) TaxID=322104 RepID=A3LT62_PICST|nr:mitochondrial ADP/ATP carrier protein [Scheffersomyces stipitis CBS 6054]ABN66353.1 mitochondrial ADP/ATP carrier protein [Scheffersomyces stipitis CBS 6054]